MLQLVGSSPKFLQVAPDSSWERGPAAEGGRTPSLLPPEPLALTHGNLTGFHIIGSRKWFVRSETEVGELEHSFPEPHLHHAAFPRRQREEISAESPAFTAVAPGPLGF